MDARLKEVSGKLTSVRLLGRFRDNKSGLTNSFDQIKAILLDVEEEHIEDEVVALPLKSLRSVSLMIEDVLDEISIEDLLQRLHIRRGIKYRVRAFFSYIHNPLMFRVKIAHKVKDIRKKFDAIRGEELSLTDDVVIRHIDPVDVGHEMRADSHNISSTIHDSSVTVGRSHGKDPVEVEREMPESSDNTSSSPIDDSSEIVGRSRDMKRILDTICNQDLGKYKVNGETLVYSILGIGGMGKTTLAELTYNDQRVNTLFNNKCWLHVSEDFKVKEIMQHIITEVTGKHEHTLTHLDILQESLQNMIRGKKFLIVLDDVRIEDDEKPKWDLLSETLSCGADGSIVLITTRSKRTSQMMTYKFPELQHQLEPLSIEDSRILFKKFAFAEGRGWDDDSELQRIGWKIVNKCEGLPLALSVVGRALCSEKENTRNWQQVLDRLESNENEIESSNEVYRVLKLSYAHLPPHVRKCFAYCSLFPEDYHIQKDVVIQLWVANGFIPPTTTGVDLYVLGEKICNILVRTNFFMVVDSNNKYRIHDLIRAMARRVMRDDCLVVIEPSEGNEVKIPNEALHLSSSYPDIQFSPEDFGEPTSLRSMFIFGEDYEFNIGQIFTHMHLKVLYLRGIGLKTLPESISKMKHLKYLNLSYSSIEVLPESIIYLQKLQVLLLNFCYRLRKLPEDLRYMSSLELLDITSCCSLMHLPVGIKEITTLRRLPRFHVGKKAGAKIGELGDLDSLDGELEISGLDNVKNLIEAERANLKCKENVSVLKFSWSNFYMRDRKLEMLEYDEKVLERLEPHSSVKKLSIYFYMGINIGPTWMMKLENLIEIGFSGCKRCESIPPLGKLPNLRVIKLLGMDSLQGFNKEDTSYDTDIFLNLQELNIFMCPSLVSLPRNLPNLKILKLEECGTLKSLPNKTQRLEELEISGCKHLSYLKRG